MPFFRVDLQDFCYDFLAFLYELANVPDSSGGDFRNVYHSCSAAILIKRAEYRVRINACYSAQN